MSTKRTSTKSFGVSNRESHDAVVFYNRKLYTSSQKIFQQDVQTSKVAKFEPTEEWQDRVFNQSSMEIPIPDSSVGLAFTSPPYNVGKTYDEDLSLEEYRLLISRVGAEVYRVLKPGGRFVVNVANLGRKPYLSIVSLFYDIHRLIGFLPMGEIIWQKAVGANGSCAWGSWMSASSPVVRDIHEYLIVFAKQSYKRVVIDRLYTYQA